MAANYNINLDQGGTFVFHFQYFGSTGAAVDLSGYTGQMQIRRSPLTDKQIVKVLNAGISYSGPSGVTTAGTGGFSMNAGVSGASLTGGVRLEIDPVTTSYIPYGKNFYDIELVKGATVDRILQGRIDCDREVTR